VRAARAGHALLRVPIAARRPPLSALHAAIFLEPGLSGAKCGLTLLGRGNEDVRLPLLPVTPPTKAVIRKAMVHAGLLN